MSTTKATRYHVRRREFLNEDVEMPAFIIGVVARHPRTSG